MCGICGIVDLNARPLPRPEIEENIVLMQKNLIHRGPDEEGSFIAGPVALGHTRLSIIDLSSGHQPMSNEDGTVWTVFNGEIFNYIELKKELEETGNHLFKTKSDTEVLVHLYEEYGEHMVEMLNGQFAFVIYDEKQKELLLARDHYGICPLFYSTKWQGRLVFASELKAILDLPEFDAQIDLKALKQAFTFWTILSPRSAFRHIKSLPPGCLARIKLGRDQSVKYRRYWHLSFPREGEEDYSRSAADWADEVFETLVKAVKIRLRADVPVGVYLSGGLDSSIIASVVRRLTDTPIETFSLSFAAQSYDETEYQKELAHALNVQYNNIIIKNSDIGKHFPKSIYHGEKPVLRSAPVPMYMLSSLVHKHGYKVVLSGEGADEVFAGYDLFKEDKIRRFWARQPESALRPLLFKRLYPFSPLTLSATGKMLLSFYKKELLPLNVFGYSHLPTWSNTRPIQNYFSSHTQEILRDYDPVEELKQEMPGEFHFWHPLHKAQYLETRILLSEYLLVSQGERMTMAHSVEGRFPFLDVTVAELASRIPPVYKLKGLTEKYILRKAFGGMLPGIIANRPKRPYGAPNKEAFFDNKNESSVGYWLSKEKISQSGIFDYKKTDRLARKCAANRQIGFRDNAAFLGIVSTQLLWEMFVNKELVQLEMEVS